MNDGLGSKNVSTSNRFDVLGSDQISDNSDVWNAVKDAVEKACGSGIPILESVVKSWNEDMVKYYTEKWNNRIMRNGSHEQQLEFEIKNLSERIVLLNQNLNSNAKSNADMMMQKTVLTTRDSSDVSLRQCYDEAYRAELAKIGSLQKERDLLKVDLFILSKKPFDKDCKETWTDEMLEYYSSRCEDIRSDRINGHLSDMDGTHSLDEVEEVTTGSASFMTQNEVFNEVDMSLVQECGVPAPFDSNIK